MSWSQEIPNYVRACLHCLCLSEQKRESTEEIMAKDMGLSPGLVQKPIEAIAALDEDLVAQLEHKRGAEPATWASYVGLSINSFYAREVCGDAVLRLPTANVFAPVSFHSTAPDIMLAVKLIKIRNAIHTAWSLDNHCRRRADTLTCVNNQEHKARKLRYRRGL